MTTHEKFMKLALKEAKKAYDKGEIPVGAVAVMGGKVIARAHNLKEKYQDFSKHAEMIVMLKALKKVPSWRLNEVSLYVTLEPCAMCAGAIIQARIEKLYFGAYDSKGGAVNSVVNLLDNNFNHKVEYIGGILEDESKALLKSFFKTLR